MQHKTTVSILLDYTDYDGPEIIRVFRNESDAVKMKESMEEHDKKHPRLPSEAYCKRDERGNYIKLKGEELQCVENKNSDIFNEWKKKHPLGENFCMYRFDNRYYIETLQVY